MQDQLIADFSLCPSLRPLGDPGICRCRGIQKAVHEQWKSIERPSLGCKQTAPRPGRTKASEVSWSSCRSWRLSSSEVGAGQRCTPLLPVWLRTHHHLSQQLIFTEGQQSWKICIEKKQFDEETWKFCVIQFF